MVDAIILSGTNPYRPINGETCKGLLQLPSSEYLIEPVIKSMQTSKHIDTIYVVGPIKRLEKILSKYNVKIIPEESGETTEGDGLVKNAIKGIEAWSKNATHPYVVFSSNDMPLVKPETIDSFVDDSINKICDIKREKELVLDYIHPMIPLEKDLEFYKNFSLKERLYLPFKEGKMRVGNMCFVNAETMVTKKEVVDFGYTLRKGKNHPIKTGIAIFGSWELAKIILNTKLSCKRPFIQEFGQISIEKTKQRLSKRYNIHVDYVIGKADLSADIDNELELKNIKI